MLNWFRGIKSEEVKVEETKPSPRKSLFSTHADENLDTIKTTVGDLLADIQSKQPIFNPAINPRMANVGMDDSSDGYPEFKMYDAGNNSVSNAVVFWYASQGFIGAQMCGIVAQNWLVNKACAMPADDAIRKGYNIVSIDGEKLEPDAVKLMKSYDRSMRLEWNMREFIRKGRIFGIRIAMFKVESTDKEYYEKPFNIDGITPNSYKGIVQVDPYWTAPMLDGPSASQPDTLHFYEPTWWIINGKKIHRSHLIIFRHAEPVDVLKPQYLYGGVPLTQQIMERIYAAERTSNEAPQLAMSKRTTVWLTDMEAVMADTSSAISRIQQWAQYRDNYGVKLGDKEGDEFQQFDTSLADFDALIMTQYQLVAAIAGVPATKLIGTSPKGFGASGDYEEASYHELLESIQTHDLTPFAERHHQLVIKSFVEPQLGVKLSAETTLNWLPLDTPTAQELAATNLAKAQAGQILVTAGAVSSEEERQRVATDKTGGYNEIGLEENEAPEAEDAAEFKETEHPRAKNGEFTKGNSNTSQSNEIKSEKKNKFNEQEHKAIKEYQNGSYGSEVGGYTNLQSVIRTGEPKYPKSWNESGNEIIKNLHSAFNKAFTEQEMTVYRGMRIEKGQSEEFLNAKVGDILSDKGITSTSKDKSIITKHFVSKLNHSDKIVEMSIKLPKGSKAIDIGKLTDENGEKEIAIAPNTKFTVLSKEIINGITKLTLQAESNETKKE